MVADKSQGVMSKNETKTKPKSSLWKPGQSGNPAGGKKLPEDLKNARMSNATAFEHTIYKYFHLPVSELKKIYSHPLTPSLDMVVIKILTKAIEHGDFQRLNFLLERTIGKVADRIEFKAKVETYHQIAVQYKELPYEELRNKYFEMLKDVK